MTDTDKQDYYMSPEYLADRWSAQDVRAQNKACREYFQDTPPAAWSFAGWLAYWETSAENVLPGAPSEFMHISEARFNELRREAAMAQGVEARPAALAPIGGGSSQEPSEAEALAQERRAFAEKVKASPWYLDRLANGIITAPFFWKGTLQDLAAALADLLPWYMGRNQTEVYRWELAEGLFSWHGKPVRASQLANAERRPYRTAPRPAKD